MYKIKHMCPCLLKGICPGLADMEDIQGWISTILVHFSEHHPGVSLPG